MISLLPVFFSKIGASSPSASVSATEVNTFTSAASPTVADSKSPVRAAAAVGIVNERLFMNIPRKRAGAIKRHKFSLDKG